eukprot:m.130469 g.130469  ORF g.130469 m.130469 type:complete len:64 (+) comp38028_c0_seq2:1762-1953(+)
MPHTRKHLASTVASNTLRIQFLQGYQENLSCRQKPTGRVECFRGSRRIARGGDREPEKDCCNS